MRYISPNDFLVPKKKQTMKRLSNDQLRWDERFPNSIPPFQKKNSIIHINDQQPNGSIKQTLTIRREPRKFHSPTKTERENSLLPSLNKDENSFISNNLSNNQKIPLLERKTPGNPMNPANIIRSKSNQKGQNPHFRVKTKIHLPFYGPFDSREVSKDSA